MDIFVFVNLWLVVRLVSWLLHYDDLIIACITGWTNCSPQVASGLSMHFNWLVWLVELVQQTTLNVNLWCLQIFHICAVLKFGYVIVFGWFPMSYYLDIGTVKCVSLKSCKLNVWPCKHVEESRAAPTQTVCPLLALCAVRVWSHQSSARFQ